MRVRYLIVLCATLTTSPAQAQFGRSSFSGAVGLNLPVGELDKQGQPGVDIAIRSGFTDPAAPWGVRGGLTFDRFGGKRSSDVDNYQYFGFFQFDVIHNSNKKTYQYAGVGLYQFKATFQPTFSNLPPTIGSGGGGSISESDVGFQGGVGLNFGTTTRTFLEIGFVDVMTSGRASAWFPIRFGIRI
jgi:hypothetical protein